jgi:signal peptidase I
MGLSSETESGRLRVRYGTRPVFRGECPVCGLRHTVAAEARPGETFSPGSIALRCQSEACGNSWTPPASAFRLEEVILEHHPDKRYTVAGPNFLLECPICQFRFTDVIERSNQTGGHKILVNKFAYRLGEPLRWDVIVFVKDLRHNYIKRLLGLPGEEVAIRGGDLYVRASETEPFTVAGKTGGPREALWFKIADTGVRERGYQTTPAWREVFERGAGLDPALASKWWTWLAKDLRWSVNILQPKERVAILRYNRRCINFYNYNLLDPASSLRHRRDPEEVGDKKVEFVVRPSEQTENRGWIGGEIRDGEFTFQFRIPVGDAPQFRASLVRLPSDPERGRPSPGRATGAFSPERVEATASLRILSESRLTFENADDRVAVSVDGEEILALEYESGSPVLRSPDDHDLLVLASGVSADFHSMRVYRDVYYTHASDGAAKLRDATDTLTVDTTGTAAYFPCGDNSPSSSDGRFWGTVPAHNMMGKAFLIFWPAWPTNWQCRFIH